jgi:flagellar basal-body rod modification protein FlgD
MTSITATNSTGTTTSSTTSANASLDQSAFLKLMTAQLQYQDPFNPMDNSEMVAQMAQFSSVSGISEMNATLKSISTQISDQTALLSQLDAALSATTTTTTAQA